jgi:hypothetical protein
MAAIMPNPPITGLHVFNPTQQTFGAANVPATQVEDSQGLNEPESQPQPPPPSSPVASLPPSPSLQAPPLDSSTMSHAALLANVECLATPAAASVSLGHNYLYSRSSMSLTPSSDSSSRSKRKYSAFDDLQSNSGASSFSRSGSGRTGKKQRSGKDIMDRVADKLEDLNDTLRTRQTQACQVRPNKSLKSERKV